MAFAMICSRHVRRPGGRRIFQPGVSDLPSSKGITRFDAGSGRSKSFSARSICPTPSAFSRRPIPTALAEWTARPLSRHSPLGFM